MKNKLLFVICIILLITAILIKPKENNMKENVIQKEVIVNYNNEKELSLDEYLIGVVGCEMPASFNYEALKAQAIAARTFAYNYLKDNVINVTSSAQCYLSKDQLLKKLNNDNTYYQILSDAVTDTKDYLIYYDNKIIKSYYFAISNGKTEDSRAVFNEYEPYLISVDSSIDISVNKFEVTNRFSKKEFCLKLSINNCEIAINDIKRDDSNRVSIITINNNDYSGIDIRKKLGLRSTDFSIDITDDEILVTTKGYGHGVGMSQYGANILASQGYSYEDILKYYYTDVEIKKI